MRAILLWLARSLCRHRLIADRVDKSSPYLSRWYLFGNARSRWFLALHQIHKSDSDAHLHTHPFSYVALQLSGLMYEHTPSGVYKRRPGYFRVRFEDSVHRLSLPAGCVWSLFLGGPRKRLGVTEHGTVWRSWGFLVGRKVVRWTKYLGAGHV